MLYCTKRHFLIKVVTCGAQGFANVGACDGVLCAGSIHNLDFRAQHLLLQGYTSCPVALLLSLCFKMLCVLHISCIQKVNIGGQKTNFSWSTHYSGISKFLAT